MLRDALSRNYEANFPELPRTMDLEDIAEDTECPFVLHRSPPCTVEVGGEPKHLALRWEASEPHELHLIPEAELRGQAVVRVSEIPSTTTWARSPTPSARGAVGEHPALLVVTEDVGDPKASIRLRPE
jgi:hypothetical protein